jgi:polyisoprenoid-binding protein YceI
MRSRAARIATAWLAAASLVAGAAFGATAWMTVLGFSGLEFTGKLDGGDFKGKFAEFDAAIVFDPADLAGSRFRVVVQTGSASTADAERDATLLGPGFFDVAKWPTATFEATRFRATGPGRFEALGKLTLRGVTREVPVAFKFEVPDGGPHASLNGEATIRRLDFGIGQGEWRDTKWLADDVKVRFGLILKRK